MGKIIDFLLTENWEEFQRIQLYKKLGKMLKGEDENLSPAQLKQIKQMMEEQQ